MVSPVMMELQELRALGLAGGPDLDDRDLPSNWFSLQVRRSRGPRAPAPLQGAAGAHCYDAPQFHCTKRRLLTFPPSAGGLTARPGSNHPRRLRPRPLQARPPTSAPPAPRPAPLRSLPSACTTPSTPGTPTAAVRSAAPSSAASARAP
jgi:hypothetical protein